MNASDILDGKVKFPAENVDQTCAAVVEEFAMRSSKLDEKDYSVYESFCETGMREELCWPVALVQAMIAKAHTTPHLLSQMQWAHCNRHGATLQFWSWGKLGRTYIEEIERNE